MQVKIGGKGQIVKCGEFMMVFNETPDMSILSPEVLKDIEQQSSGGGGSASSTPPSGPPKPAPHSAAQIPKQGPAKI